MCNGKQRCAAFTNDLKIFCEDRTDVKNIITLNDGVAVVLDNGDISCLSHDPRCAYPVWRHIDSDRDKREFWASQPEQ